MKRPPPCVPPLRIASSMPPPPTTPSFGWVLRRTIAQRPFKAGAPPVSQYSDGRHFGAPKKGTKRSAHEPGRRTPPSGSWEAAATQFGCMEDVVKEREGEADGRYRVRSGSSCVLCCVCVCVCCVCVDPLFPTMDRPLLSQAHRTANTTNICRQSSQ
jgi:hypothetical protein